MTVTEYPYSFSDTAVREAAKLEDLRKQVMGSMTGADFAYMRAAAEAEKAMSEPWRGLGISQRDWSATQGIMDALHFASSGFSDSEYLNKLKRDLIGPSRVNEYQHLADTAADALKATEAQGWWNASEPSKSAWETATVASKSGLDGLTAVAPRDELISAAAQAVKDLSGPWRQLGIAQRDWSATQGIMDAFHSSARSITESESLDKLKRDLLGPFTVVECHHLGGTAAGALKAIEAQCGYKGPGASTSAWEIAVDASKSEIAGLATASMRDELVKQDAISGAARLEAMLAHREPVIEFSPPFIAPLLLDDHGSEYRRDQRQIRELQRRQVVASEAVVEQLREEVLEARAQASIERSRFRLTLITAIAGVAATVLVFLVPHFM